MQKTQEEFDVVVIGAGAAGLMAAGRAAELGAKVAIIDKNKTLGRKLLITGKGRCNITQAEFNDKEFIKKLGKKSQWLFSALAVFGPEKVINFFESRGLKTKTERGGRVFPESDRAQDVLDVLLRYLKEKKVKIFSGEPVLGLDAKNKKIIGVKLANRQIGAKSFILSTGGKAYPVTGSTGDGYAWAKDLGHEIVKPVPALVPIETKEVWPKKLQGLSLKNVNLNLWQNNKKQDFRFGEMLFTHFGLSGPIVLDISKKIGELLPQGEVTIEIDLKPALDIAQLEKRLQRDFSASGNKDFKNYLPDLVPQKMTEIIIKFSGLDANRKLSSITKEERKKIAMTLKSLRTGAQGLMGFDQAIVTSGGVNLNEIDSRSMKSRIIDNLFFAGEILDLDGPTGGYNLQICWSTGYLAGTKAAE
jgi:hypothetical protein